ncbi:hypothetical protein ACFQKB_13250 [Actinomadura yumaensis]|uniref:Uncharacterized protein n=1 Tax=Actinomadura yumaensis TaxID=111807 RepID=A0ABW2CFY9_9ACTN
MSADRYEQLVAEARELVTAATAAQFGIGDRALEIEPMTAAGSGGTSDEAWGVTRSLQRFADDIGMGFHSIKEYRWTASRWPKQYRRSHRAGIGGHDGRRHTGRTAEGRRDRTRLRRDPGHERDHRSSQSRAE